MFVLEGMALKPFLKLSNRVTLSISNTSTINNNMKKT